MSSYPELEPSLVEVAIGEVDEPPSPTSGLKGHPLSKDHSDPQIQTPPTEVPPAGSKGQRSSRPVQRSMSDRYSYRAAIYLQDQEYDPL